MDKRCDKEAADLVDAPSDAHSRPVDQLHASNVTEEVTIRMEESVMVDTELTAAPGERAKEIGEKMIVRRSNILVPDHEKTLLARAFPELLPYGVGGPETPRAVAISRFEWAKHAIQLSHRRFARHAVFLFNTFDSESRRRALQACSLRCQRLSPQDNAAVARLTPDELKQTLAYQEKVRSAFRLGQQLPPEPPRIGAGQIMVSTVSSASSWMWGTNQERLVHRRRAWSMVNELGWPHLFLTISPNDSGQFTVAYYAGEVMPSGPVSYTHLTLPTNREV